MDKYEYVCKAIVGAGKKTTRVLNAMGKEGWELVDVCWIWHYFKRKI